LNFEKIGEKPTLPFEITSKNIFIPLFFTLQFSWKPKRKKKEKEKRRATCILT
jgi:hypothetical protein